MSFFRRTPEEKAARASLKAEKERLYVAKTRAKAARASLKANEVALKQQTYAARSAARQTRLAGKARLTAARTRRTATRLQTAEEKEERRYVTAEDRLDHAERRTRAKQVRVRGISPSQKAPEESTPMKADEFTVQGETPRLGRVTGRTGFRGVHRLHLRRTTGLRAGSEQTGHRVS